MKSLKIILLLIYILTSKNLNSQIDATTALVTMEELDVTIENTMNSLELLTGNAIGDSGNMLISALSRLREDIKNTIGETDLVLRGNQQILFDKLNREIQNFSEISNNSLANIDDIATKVTSALNDFFRKKREPRILVYKTPTHILNNEDPYILNVSGEDFDRSYESYLLLDQKKKKIDQITSNKMKVIIPSKTMNLLSNDSLRFIKAKFVFKYKQGWLFKKNKEKSFDFVIPCVPKKIGYAIAYYEQKTPQIESFPYKTYTANASCGGSNWRGKRKTGKAGINILPTQDRFIDPTTVKITEWNKRYGGGYIINTVTEQYIRGSIYCKSQNKCYGGGGSSTLKLKYREFKINYPLTQSQTKSVMLESDRISIIELPDSIDGNRPYLNYVKVFTFDGKEHIITTSNPSPYFDLSQNPTTDDLELKFKT